jgi:peptidoglycan/xylan/chitin deacetylase (PgdA/CDA1 family)
MFGQVLAILRPTRLSMSIRAAKLQTLRARTAPVAKTALLHFGGYAAVRRLLPSHDVAILRYHAICGPEGHSYADPAICVSPQAFQEHVAYIAASYAVLPLQEIATRLRDSRPLPRNCVAITFDDGYADNLAAARTLSRYGLTATFYITAGCMADGDPFWPSELRGLIHAIPSPFVRLSIDRGAVEIPLQTVAERRKAVNTITKLIKANPIRVREALRQQLHDAADVGPLPSPMLRWSDIAEMQRLGMTIGSHTLTHPNLPNAWPSDASREIYGSKMLLERELGAPVTMFSYPNGGAERYMTSDIARLVKEAGFEAATTSRNAFAGPRSDLFALERIQVAERLEDLVFALEIERFAFRPAPRAAEERRMTP